MSVLALATAVLLGCFTANYRQPGTLIRAATLREKRADLPGFVANEIARKRYARAFYALEVHKLRGYGAMALAAHHPLRSGELMAAHKDLRPVFASAFGAARVSGTAVASRGMTVVPGDAPPAMSAVGAEADALFWTHLEVAQSRFGAQLPYDQVVRGSLLPVSVAETGLLFARHETFVSFFVHGDRVHAFVVRGRKLRVVRLPTPASELRARVAAFNQTLRTPPRDPADTSWRAPAAALYADLLVPLGRAVTGKRIRALYISADDFLAQVPFGVLIADGKPLLARTLVTYLPSASLYRQLVSRDPVSVPPSFLAVGNPTYPEGVPPLPYAELEAETLATVFSRSALLVGGDATEQHAVAAVEGHNILHFATHGVLLGAAVPGASSLMFAADDRHDGFLSAIEISGLDLSHIYLAVLSACETSVGDGPSAALGSMTAAFLVAGAPSVVGTLWKVADTSTTRMMIDFYRHFLSAGAGEALRQAQLRLAAQPAYAHPYYWGPFVLHGWTK